MADQDNAEESGIPAGVRDVPALYVNRFNILVGPITTRITFGEAVLAVDASFRTAVVMKTSDAEELGKLLLEIIARSATLQSHKT